jgi:AraC-like DNA-binding protein
MRSNEQNLSRKTIEQLKQWSLLFPDSLWKNVRNKSTTPIFVERFKGIRNLSQYGSHDFWEFTAVAHGSGEIFWSRGKIKLTQFDIVLMPPDIAHYEYAESLLDTIWIGFDGKDLNLPCDAPIRLNSEDIFNLINSFWIFSSCRCKNIGMELDGRLLSILGLFIRLHTEDNFGDTTNMDKIITYMNEHFMDKIDMADLARMLKISESYFYRQFKSYAGVTPIQYLTDLRIKNVLTNIRKTHLPIYQIAQICGFSDPYYLSKTFKKIVGVSPQQYRDGLKDDSATNL